MGWTTPSHVVSGADISSAAHNTDVIDNIQYLYDYLPRGYIASATVTAVQSSISTVADVTGLTATWTAPANRRYKMTVLLPVFQNSGAAGTLDVFITTSSNTAVATSQIQVPASSYAMAHAMVVVAPSAGSITYKVRMSTSASTCQTAVAATIPGLFLIEDIGHT